MSDQEESPKKFGVAGSIAAGFIDSKLTPLIILFAILLGAFAVWALPREEEPQIIVPMIDVFVTLPGASAREVEERITKPLEKLPKLDEEALRPPGRAEGVKRGLFVTTYQPSPGIVKLKARTVRPSL